MSDGQHAADRDDVVAAISELKAIRSTDPCAAIATTTIKATIHTLETRWLTDASTRIDDGDRP